MADEEFEAFFQGVLEKIKERRKELGLTQGQLGERMGKPQSAIARIESGGVKDPGISTLFQVCKALEVRPGLLADKAFLDSLGMSPHKANADLTSIPLAEEISQLPANKRDQVYRVMEEVLRLL